MVSPSALDDALGRNGVGDGMAVPLAKKGFAWKRWAVVIAVAASLWKLFGPEKSEAGEPFRAEEAAAVAPDKPRDLPSPASINTTGGYDATGNLQLLYCSPSLAVIALDGEAVEVATGDAVDLGGRELVVGLLGRDSADVNYAGSARRLTIRRTVEQLVGRGGSPSGRNAARPVGKKRFSPPGFSNP